MGLIIKNMKSTKKGIFVSLAIAGCMATVVFSESMTKQTVGESSYTSQCAKIRFGSLTGSGGSTSFYSEVSSIVVSSYSCTGTVTQQSASNDSKYAVKIGTGSASGAITLTFNSAYVIQSANIYCTGLSGTALSTTSINFICGDDTGTIVEKTDSLKSKTATMDLEKTPEEDSNIISFDGLNDVSRPSKWITIGNNGGTSNNNFYLFQISLKLLVASEPEVTSSEESGNYSPVYFNFIDVKNESGDCTYIKAGDNDILIDAGSTASCASTISSYLSDSSRKGNYVSDNKLEYVIATHAHEDHIAAFAGVSDSSKASGYNGILYNYDVGTIIDFPRTTSTSTTYANYQTSRDYAVNKGAKHFTALQCYNNEGGGASRTYDLGNNLSMSVLYNYYYDHTASGENDYSVCLLFTKGSKSFLFTGDLESSGESYLVANNTLPTVDLFKAAHHGSYTANTDALLSVIQPKTVCFECCAGSTKYTTVAANTFPSQEAINRIAPYTNDVYVTGLGNTGASGYSAPFNGSVVVSYDSNGTKSINCTNNNTKLKDTSWFSANRTTPSAWAS